MLVGFAQVFINISRFRSNLADSIHTILSDLDWQSFINFSDLNDCVECLNELNV